MTQLREHWEDTSEKVLSRRNQLETLLGEQQQFESSRRESEAWLARMEAWRDRGRRQKQDQQEIKVRLNRVRHFY